MTIATSATIKFSMDKAANQKLILSAVAAACKALKAQKNVLKFEGVEVICDQNNVHDLSLKDAGKQAVFTLQFASTKGVCLLSVRPSNTTFHPEQTGCYWAKFQAPMAKAVLLGIFDTKGKKIGECVKYVPAPDATPFTDAGKTDAASEEEQSA